MAHEAIDGAVEREPDLLHARLARVRMAVLSESEPLATDLDMLVDGTSGMSDILEIASLIAEFGGSVRVAALLAAVEAGGKGAGAAAFSEARQVLKVALGVAEVASAAALVSIADESDGVFDSFLRVASIAGRSDALAAFADQECLRLRRSLSGGSRHELVRLVNRLALLAQVLSLLGHLEGARGILEEVHRSVPSTKRGRAHREALEERLAFARGENSLPIPESVPARGRRDGDVAYLLHNCLPFRDAGYAMRSHGLLTALAAADWSMVGVTRPDYPLLGSDSRQGRSKRDTTQARHRRGRLRAFPQR